MATPTNQTVFNDFSVPINGYAAFDALSLKSLIIARLNQSGNFSDQNFEGSNISAIIDIIAYTYHTLLFYLNRTGTESTFSTAELYENINKIVKLIGYNPIGNQTSILPFNATANASLLPNTYTIPRYSYFTVNGVNFSFNSDTTFTKATSAIEVLTDLQNNTLLYQGTYGEYPIYQALGAPYEVLTLVLVDNNGNNLTIDHFNIDVYVQNNTVPNPTWALWSPTQSLFLERSNSLSYEIRLNESQHYEIKFGNNINGQQLNAGDYVAVYYLKSDGTTGQIDAGVLDGNSLLFFSTQQFNQIQTNTTPVNLNLITTAEASNIEFTNTSPSTEFNPVEDVDSIRDNATNTFQSQFRLITTSDFVNYITNNYSNIVSSVQAVNNWDYISGHLQYYFNLGVDQPNLNSRILFNQVNFSDACNFSNIYVYAVPKLQQLTSLTTRANYLNAAQKQLILNNLSPVKVTTAEIIIQDPIYMAVDVAANFIGEALAPVIATDSYLQITRSITAKSNPQSIMQQVANIFTSYFATTQNNLGALVSLTQLTNSILDIDGVQDISTVRTEGNDTVTIPGISLIIYNPVYPYDDIQIITQDIQLPYFKFPFLNNSLDFINKISVVTPSIQSLQSNS